MNWFFIFHRTFVLSGILALLLTPACREKEHPEKKPRATAKPSKSRKAKPLDRPLVGIDKAVEEFTGVHTRIVWAEHQRLNDSDTFANGNQLVLKGLDTRDGRGERMLQNRLDNYSRPLLTSDGEFIVFTDKDVKSKSGRKHYDPDIYRTDWKGTKPLRIAEGYAVDCWRDPETDVEWVYAARGFKATKGLSLEAAKLVRFKLDEPTAEEVVYDDGPISPDNIQFSRDGSHASCLFPWPNVGVLQRGKDGRYHARKLLTGCWPSLSPDNSYVEWVFDGGHRGATFFNTDDKKRWSVGLNQGPGMGGHEMYHPRWSNHPRYLVITGPYLPVKTASGNVINKGGASAEIHLGRLDEKLEKVEAWLQITHDKLSESYPDVWIDGADEVQLAAYERHAPAAEEAAPSQERPAVKDALVFLWQDRGALNQFTGRDGRTHNSGQLEAHGAARHGRLEEMIVSGGEFVADSEAATTALDGMAPPKEVTVEMLLLPDAPTAGGPSSAVVPVFRGPGFALSADGHGALVLAQDGTAVRSVDAVRADPFHLAITRKPGGFELFINGSALVLAPHAGAAPVPVPEKLIFGGGWNGGILGVAIHARALNAEEVKRQATAQLARLSKLPPAPPRVKLSARLAEASPMPTAEGIAPYTGSLVAYVYEIEKVLEGRIEAKRILVKHWAMLDQKTLQGFPRETGQTYELTLEREADHPNLKGERVMDDTTAFDLEPWFDAAPPQVP